MKIIYEMADDCAYFERLYL